MNVENGFVDVPVKAGLDLPAEIRKLKEEKECSNSGPLLHGWRDSGSGRFRRRLLALARIAETLDNDIIVMCGVHFMGETVKILCPGKRCLFPTSMPDVRLPTAAPPTSSKSLSGLIPTTP